MKTKILIAAVLYSAFSLNLKSPYSEINSQNLENAGIEMSSKSIENIKYNKNTKTKTWAIDRELEIKFYMPR
ncbi:hypothetical protein ACFLTE_03755 [Bacteroidota bacterium]